MFYVEKFIAAWLLPPGIFIAFLLLTAGYMYYKKLPCRRCILAAALCLYLLSTSFAARFLLLPLEECYAPQAGGADAIVLLGGGATGGTPDVGGAGNVQPHMANRILTALQLYRQTGLPVLVTGGTVFSGSGNEGQIARRILLKAGVAEADIIVEDKARNTRENALYTASLCESRGYRRIYLVTSAFHMPRSMATFSRQYLPLGIGLVPYPCDYLLNRAEKVTAFSFTPTMDNLALSAMALREYLGLLALKAGL